MRAVCGGVYSVNSNFGIKQKKDNSSKSFKKTMQTPMSPLKAYQSPFLKWKVNT